MKRNASFKRIGDKLKEAKSVYLYPHENPDGDAIGSCIALCRMLRGMGKVSYVLVDEDIPDNLRFMDPFRYPEHCIYYEAGECRSSAAPGPTDIPGRKKVGGVTYCGSNETCDPMIRIGSEGLDVPEVSMCVDSALLSRFPKRADFFKKAPNSISLDHHLTDDPVFDINRIEPNACATGELVYRLMKSMGHTPTKEEGEALFAAITTDSGNFQYSNTTKMTHKIVCDLYDCGIDVTGVSTSLYENEPMRKIALISLAVERMELFGNGQVAATKITNDMLEKTGAVMSDAEPVVATIRSIKGVEIALVFKEKEKGVFVSMRAKTDGDVQKIAASFGGGGHRKAAGCTVKMTMEEAYDKIVKAAVDSLKK